MTSAATDYRDEVHQAMAKIIGKAWADESYKQELISNPRAALSELGVNYPDHYDIKFVDDPSAKPGEWRSEAKGQTAVLTVPIPAKPAGGKLSADDLEAVAGAGSDCCCCTGLCTCTGAVSQETWY